MASDSAIPSSVTPAASPSGERVDHRRPGLGAPITPGCLLWRLAGDSRNLLVTGSTGVLQNLHPAISQALLDHSDYFDDPIDRLARSSGPIGGVIFDEQPEATGRELRDWHRPIRSLPGAEFTYRALDPNVFFWAHATFVQANLTTQELVGTPLSRRECEQFYAESITWWRRYGMTMAPVPQDYAAFRRYWDEMFASVLEATPVAVHALTQTRFPVAPLGIPSLAWQRGGAEWLAVRSATWVTQATLPPEARELLGIRWSWLDQQRARALFTAIRRSWPLVPPPARLLPRASAAQRRLAAQGRAAAGCLMA